MFYVAAVCSVLLASSFGSEHLPGNRILGGNETSTTLIPYQVSIEANNALRCSGSVVSPSWVVTVANCLVGVKRTDLRVRVNAVLRGVLGDLHEVLSLTLHPDYNPETMDYDVALLEINGATNKPVTIAKDVPFDGLIARVSGWGASSSGEWLSAQLSEKDVTIVYFNDCKYLYESIGNPVTERMLCASSTYGGPCQGDAGDPLVYNRELIGMMSWSFGCGDGTFPAVYTDVTKLREWILGTITLPPIEPKNG